ncbi:SusC/RagA family TonB-linked outer membrane protein [Bacteroides sp.]
MKKIISIVTMLLVPLMLMAQVSLSGVVKDAKSGEPLIGVSILIEGTSSGTVTDFDGKFKLSVPNGDVKLTVSYIGYRTETVATKGQRSIIISLSEDTQTLDEVVVVGYGVQKKETLVGSISTVKSDALVSVPASNLTQTLAGKASGLAIVQSSGEIGRDEAQIFIRGKATFESNSAQPLIIVDGVIQESFAQIDPNEVESINILKDASATAVYGVKGANGVIIVTTKRGITGKAQVSFSAQMALNTPMRLHKPIEGYRTAILRDEMDDNAGVLSRYSVTQLMNWRTKASPYTEPDVDWMDEIMKSSSMQQQYNINVRGGTRTVRYFLSGGYFDQDSPFKNDKITNFNRFNFRSNLDIDVTRDLSVSLNMGARIENRKYPNSMYWNSWEIYHGAFSQSGIKYPVYNMDGSYAPNNLHALLKDSGSGADKRTVMEVALNAEYKLDWLLKGLAIKGQVAYDDNTKHAKLYTQTPAVYEYMYPTDSYILKNPARPLKYDWDDVGNARKLYWEGAVTYTRDFGKHNINALLLFNQLLRGNEAEQYYATQGLVGRLTYNYAQTYLAEINFGLNGSENFAPNKRYGLFPAFSLGWIVSKEKFWQESGINNVFNHLKIRGSLGWVGNDRSWAYIKEKNAAEEQRFIYLQQYLYSGDNGGYMFGDNKVEGIRSLTIANPDVTWEKSRKINIGIETGFFNNLLTLNAEYFHEFRKDILAESENIPSYFGATAVPSNIGRIKNQGVEIEIAHNNQLSNEFSYFVKGNFSFARNKIIERGTAKGVLPYQRAEGFAIDTPLKYITEGFFQSFEEIENSPSQLGITGNVEVRPGDLKYRDINGDGIIDIYDQIRTGFPTTPEIQYGLNVGFTWKGFDVSALFQGTANVSYDKNWEIMWAFSNNDNVFPRHWYYWTPEMGDAAAQYTQLYGKYYNNEAGADYTLSDGSYVRFKNLDVGYTFPEEWTKKVFINNLRIYVSALNLVTWSKEKGLDPDNRHGRGADMPPMRSVNFGININF